jgi:mRNA-degrading endonuclease YafQ of YafQ-DinJ toxin-antitoxin module
MPADSNPFRVLTTPGFERDFRKISRGRPPLVEAMEELLAILRRDPHDRTGQHKIKKLAGYKVGEGQWRVRWKETGCGTTSLETMLSCTRFGTGKDAY